VPRFSSSPPTPPPPPPPPPPFTPIPGSALVPTQGANELKRRALCGACFWFLVVSRCSRIEIISYREEEIISYREEEKFIKSRILVQYLLRMVHGIFSISGC
jgi:hypothetical protein